MHRLQTDKRRTIVEEQQMEYERTLIGLRSLFAIKREAQNELKEILG